MRIHLISSPRNVSTALMYSFAQRTDTRVVDEPFYAHYLMMSGAEHPGRADILASQPHRVEEVLDGLDSMDTRPLLFIKGMAHHLQEVDPTVLAAWTSVFLIREPRQLIASFAQVIAKPTMQDIGLARMSTLYQAIRSAGGKALVLDSADLVRDPQAALEALCAALGIPFQSGMLKWEAGPRPEDGVWAPHWYANVHRSTGFAPQATSTRPLPEQCRDLYAEALPHYEALQSHALTV